MGKFTEILTVTGDALIQKRAENVSLETKDVFEDEKRNVEKRIRAIKNEITSMEDLSVKSTQTLIVGENLNTKDWVNKRINLALELRDKEIELEVIKKLIEEYFD